MESIKEIPSALILTYARQRNCLAILNSLIMNGCKKIYIYLDAPKTPEVHVEQNILLSRLADRSFIPDDVILEVKQSEKNKGIAISMVNSLDWFFAQETEGVILEDDLKFSKGFLYFASTMLSRFRDEDEVMMISGNRYSESINGNKISWCNYPQTWGWATWRRSWRVLRKAYFDEISLSSFSLISPRNNFWTMGAHYVAQGAVDTWDIPIANYMIKSRLFTVLPPQNLVSNIGDDNFATHTKVSQFPIRFPIFDVKAVVDQNIVNSENRNKLSKRENRFLEKRIFHIKFYHLFLPIKFLFTKKNRQNSLAKRLNYQP